MFSSILLGIGVGFCAALLGLGGNVFIIPLLPLIRELSLQEVIATGIFTVSLVTLFNSIKFYRQGLLNFRLILKLLPATALAGYFGAKCRGIFSDFEITLVLVVVLTLMVLRLFFFKPKPISKGANFFSISAAAISGTVAGITGIGTGVLLGPSLLTVNLCDHKEISPVINFLIFVNATFASLTQWGSISAGKMGQIDLEIVGILVLTSLAGSFFGRKLNQKISRPLRQNIVGFMLILIAIKLAIPHVNFFL